MQTSVMVPAVEAGGALPGAPPSVSPAGAADSERFFQALLGALLSAASAPPVAPVAASAPAPAEPPPPGPRAGDPAQASWLDLWLPLLNLTAAAAPSAVVVAPVAPAGAGDTPPAGSAAAPVTPVAPETAGPVPGPALSSPDTSGERPALEPTDAAGGARPTPDAAAPSTTSPAGAPVPLDARPSVAAPFAASAGATPGAYARPAHPARPQTDPTLRLTDGVLPDRPTEAAPLPDGAAAPPEAPGGPEQPAPAPDTLDLSLVDAGPSIHARNTATPPGDRLVDIPSARPLTDGALDAIIHQARLTTVPGRSSVRLRLQPAELGTVEVTIDVTSRGAAVHLAVASPEVQSVIERQLPALRSALEANGFSADRLIVTADPLGAGLAGQPSFDHGRQGLPWRHGQPPAGAGVSRAGGVAGPATAIDPSSGALARSGLIDCRA